MAPAKLTDEELRELDGQKVATQIGGPGEADLNVASCCLLNEGMDCRQVYFLLSDDPFGLAKKGRLEVIIVKLKLNARFGGRQCKIKGKVKSNRLPKNVTLSISGKYAYLVRRGTFTLKVKRTS